jgi:hypothetical protein
MSSCTESTFKQAVVDWLIDLGYACAYSLEIAFDSAVRTLAALRNALLPRLLRGEVRVAVHE